MENEKRMVGDYTVLCAVNIGSREIILAENEQDSSGERFLCCYGERNDIFEKFTECAVGDDYIDAALFFAERIKQDAERFRAEVEKLDIPVTVITEADCIPDHYKNDINGKIIAINPAVLKPEYQRADRQLYLVTGGFGASANARGSAVFCRNLYDGTYAPMEPPLPPMCYSVLPSTGEVIQIDRWQKGYTATSFNDGNRAENEAIKDKFNEKLGVSKAQEQAMLAGSMIRWDSIAAKPKSYDENGKAIKPKDYER